MFDFRRATVFSLGYRLSKRKMTTCSKNLEGHGPLRHVVAYCVKRSMSESVAMLPHCYRFASTRLKNPLYCEIVSATIVPE